MVPGRAIGRIAIPPGSGCRAARVFSPRRARHHGTMTRQEQKRRIAFHESGHATLALDCDFDVVSVTIATDSAIDSLGRTGVRNQFPEWFAPACTDLRSRDHMESVVSVCFAGPEAERRLAGRCHWRSAQHDVERAKALASCAYDSPVVPHFLRYMKALTRAWVARDKNWAMIQAVAEALLVQGELSGEQVRALCRPELVEALP
jgi:hypothetical protein